MPERFGTPDEWKKLGRRVKANELCRRVEMGLPVYLESQTELIEPKRPPSEGRKPQMGVGDYRHCYIGQEAVLLATLRDKGMTLDEFNAAWDEMRPWE